MTKMIMKWFLDALSVKSLGIVQVEPYEGQFEDPEDTTVFPPAAFVAIMRLSNQADEGDVELQLFASVYLVTTHIAGASHDGALDLMDSVTAALHDKGVRYVVSEGSPSQYFGRCLLVDGDFVGILPGMAVYRLNFKIVE